MPTSLEKTLIVMPALNEEASVADVIREVKNALPDVHCLVVDDGSTDATARVAREAGATVLCLPFNLGVGGAMRAGFKYAMANGFDNVVQVDSDGQHDPNEVVRLLDELRTSDLVLGSRFEGSDSYVVKGPRRWAMVTLAVVLTRVTGTKLDDTTSGFKAMGPRAVRLFATHYPAEYLGDTIEALVIAARAKLVIKQVAVTMRQRSGGTPSHNPFKSAAYLGRACLALVFALWRPASSLKVGTN